MPTLYINAPRWRVTLDGAGSFDDTLRSRVGRGYAFSRQQRRDCHTGCRVVLLANDRKRRAEGRLRKLVPTEAQTDNGLWRYDVYMVGAREVPYRYARVGRSGVAVR